MTHPFAANAQGFIDTCNTPETQGDFVLAFPCINIKQLTINLDKCLRTKYIYPPMRLRSGGSSVEPVGN